MDDGYKDNQTQLPDDDATPFSEPEDFETKRSDTHPQTDTNVDSDEVYHEGLDVATTIDPDEPEEHELRAADTH